MFRTITISSWVQGNVLARGSMGSMASPWVMVAQCLRTLEGVSFIPSESRASPQRERITKVREFSIEASAGAGFIDFNTDNGQSFI